MEELWEWDNDTNKLNPILDPLVIKTNIIKEDDMEIIEMDIVKKEYKEINKNSILNNIKMMFFRHQHILKMLNRIIVVLKFIEEFSTSKVDIFINY